MQYLGARGSDGETRKYRVMMINGEIYPLHAAISNHWKIHYFIADMTDNPEHRAEDAVFLENTPDTLGPLAMSALHQIQSMLGLDYAGVDFGLSAKGEVLVFEANATMVVNPRSGTTAGTTADRPTKESTRQFRRCCWIELTARSTFSQRLVVH